MRRYNASRMSEKSTEPTETPKVETNNHTSGVSETATEPAKETVAESVEPTETPKVEVVTEETFSKNESKRNRTNKGA
ncbi:MAG: hypothetical protein KBT03_05850 [Bacteroidales bacterium]|nr:hypothetical protein [Candidatus Scybalousia scybalohippi]